MRAWMLVAVAGVCGAVGAQVPEIRPMARIESPAVERDAGFGRWVTVRGDRMVVTMRRSGYGSMYRSESVFGYDISDPGEPRLLWWTPAPDRPRSVQGRVRAFGWQTVMSDHVLAVSASQSEVHEPYYMEPGMVFLLDPDTGHVLSEIIPPLNDNELWDSLFGSSLAIDGDRLVVGMPRNSSVAWEAGAAYLYDISDPRNPVLLHEMYPDAGTLPLSRFGSSVALDGDTVVIADPQDYKDGGYRSGEVHVFDAVSGDRIAVLHPEPDTGWDAFATHVGTGNGVIVTNANDDRVNGSDARGAVYFFDAVTFERLNVLRPEPGSGEFMGWTIRLDGMFLRASQSVIPAPLSGTRTWDISDPRMPVRIVDHVQLNGETEPGPTQPGFLAMGSPAYDGDADNQGAVLIFPAGPCSKADLAGPYEVLNMFDIAEYIDAWRAGDAMRADLALPAGVLDIRDVQAFLDAYVAGCPGG